jgi:magnesium-transporting ATPase (P-type)
MIGALANNAGIEKTNGSLHIIGDPTEGALLVAAEKARNSRY